MGRERSRAEGRMRRGSKDFGLRYKEQSIRQDKGEEELQSTCVWKR